MAYLVNFGGDTEPELYNSMDEILEWLEDYIISHLLYGQSFEDEIQRFIDNHIERI